MSFLHTQTDQSHVATPTTLRRRLYLQLDPAAWPSRGLSPVNSVLTAAILIGTGAAIIETEPMIARDYALLFHQLELGLGVLFLIEYMARLWTIVEDGKGTSSVSRRLHFMLSPAALLDLLAIIATLAPFIAINALALRLIRLLRLLRIAKLGRMSLAMRHLIDAVASRRYELFLTLVLACGMLIFGASALYWLEGELQPDKFGSIPRAMWWSVVTLTTIGYGDVYPITAAGKFVAAFVAIAGIGLIAMPTGILAAAFSDAVQRGAHSSERKSSKGWSE